MHYYSQFKDINGTTYQVDIYTGKGNGDIELTLGESPVIVEYESNGLFSPIKSQSCTITILTETALLDLYTTDPQGIRVVVAKVTGSSSQIVFRGYATPCQYGQDWTWKDFLTLECVECLSSLKYVNYTCMNGQYAKYVPLDRLICYLLSKVEHPDQDELYHTLRWNWPQDNFKAINYMKYNGSNTAQWNTLQSTAELLSVVAVNEANFFDDDQEETPWTCYEVLEEICKFFNVTLTMYNGQYFFIDYLPVAREWHQNDSIHFWQYNLDCDVNDASYTVNFPIMTGMMTAGTMEIALDEVYNKISVDANRYDLDKVASDVFDKNRHKSLTLYYDFGGSGETYTESHTNFWGSTVVDKNTTTFKTYCILDGSNGWRHRWWSPRTLQELTGTETGYSTAMNGYSQYISLPENKYINTIGATILHYATIDATNRKPSSLEWNDCIMFNCLTDTIRPTSTNTMGKCTIGDLKVANPIFEKPVLEYESDQEMNYSPADGTSWIVINGSLWYQQYRKKNETNSNGTMKEDIAVVDTIGHKEIMWPIESATDKEPYIGKLQRTVGSSEYNLYFGHSNDNDYGFELLRVKLQIGNKYWNGTSWTTNDSSFYLRFTGSGIDGKFGGVNYNTKDDAFGYLTWMNIITNTTYQDKVGTDGYAIPITAANGICGKLKLTIYTPRQLPLNSFSSTGTTFNSQEINWYERAPIVFMKDFSIDYAYTDESPWWLDGSHDKKDLKYTNYTAKRYTYENVVNCKINSWQKGNPIAKSFPIAAVFEGTSINPQSAIYYVETMKDEYMPNLVVAQEENITMRQLRHYSEPRLKAKVNLRAPVAPWAHVTFNQATGFGETVFVVDKQSFDLKKMNSRVEFVEFGDTTIR